MTFKEYLESKHQKALEEKISQSRWAGLRASGIQDVCLRRLYLYRTSGELAKPFGVDVQAIFEEGKTQETETKKLLLAYGIEVLKPIQTERWEGISCSPDGVIEYDGKRILIEIKSVSENSWNEYQTVQDIWDSTWGKKYIGQIQIGMFLFGLSYGAFILKRKACQQLRIIEVPRDDDYIQSLLNNANLVNEAIKSDTPPDYLANNPVECRRCAFFGTVCNPPLNFDGEIANIEDEELARKLARRDELAEARTEYEHLDKEVKERIKEIPHAICGDFEIIGKKRIVEYKAKEAWRSEQWITKINKITTEGEK